MPNPFSWDYLNTVPPNNDVLDGWSILMLVIFAGGFLLGSLAYYRPRLTTLRGVFPVKSIQWAASVALWICGAGLFFFLVQLLQIDPFTFGRRIWMFLMLIAALIYIGVMGYRVWQKRSERRHYEIAVASGAIKRPPPQRRPVRRRRV